VLLAFLERYELPNWEKSAIDAELARADLPQTQTEMLARIHEKKGGLPTSNQPPPTMQMTLEGMFS
jgi:hypothetical protein